MVKPISMCLFVCRVGKGEGEGEGEGEGGGGSASSTRTLTHTQTQTHTPTQGVHFERCCSRRSEAAPCQGAQ